MWSKVSPNVIAVAQDQPPPTIPADTAEKLALRLMERRSEERKEAE